MPARLNMFNRVGIAPRVFTALITSGRRSLAFLLLAMQFFVFVLVVWTVVVTLFSCQFDVVNEFHARTLVDFVRTACGRA
jgi:hypothetical protein